MHSSDIKIKTNKTPEEEKKTKVTVDSGDFIVSGAEVGQEFLKNFKSSSKKKERVIYVF